MYFYKEKARAMLIWEHYCRYKNAIESHMKKQNGRIWMLENLTNTEEALVGLLTHFLSIWTFSRTVVCM